MRADLLVLLYVMFPCVFVNFPYGVWGKVWYFILADHFAFQGGGGHWKPKMILLIIIYQGEMVVLLSRLFIAAL